MVAMDFKSLLLITVLVYFGCTNNNDEESCAKTKSEFTTVSGWLQLKSPNPDYLVDVSFLNDDFGIVSNNFGKFYKTDSGGLCWEELQVLVDEYGGSLFSEFYILNENEIFASRVGFYKTNDGGKTFKEIETNDVWGGSNTFDMYFFNENKGILCKSGVNLYKTEDGGKNWTNIYPQYGAAQKLQFVTDNVGYLYGGSNYDNVNYGELHKSVDGGNTWFKIESESNIARALIRTMYFVDENRGYFFNSLREFYVTQNGGLTWTLRSTIGEIILDMVFVNEEVGYAVGGSRSIYKTEDRGVTWNEDYLDEDVGAKLVAITKTASGKIVVVGKNGTILKKE